MRMTESEWLNLMALSRQVIQNLLDFAHIRIYIHGHLPVRISSMAIVSFSAGALKGGSRIPDDFVDVKVGLVQKHSLGI